MGIIRIERAGISVVFSEDRPLPFSVANRAESLITKTCLA